MSGQEPEGYLQVIVRYLNNSHIREISFRHPLDILQCLEGYFPVPLQSPWPSVQIMHSHRHSHRKKISLVIFSRHVRRAIYGPKSSADTWPATFQNTRFSALYGIAN